MIPHRSFVSRLGFSGVGLLVWVVACDGTAVRTLDDETVTVACGSCVFEMPEVEGCPWAAEVDGRYVLVQGKVPGPETHDGHAPDGMCNMARKATVSGELRKDALVVSKMELLPAESTPEQPRFTTSEH